MLGVAFMAGTLVLTDTDQRTFDDLFADAYGTPTPWCGPEASFDDPNGFGDLGPIDAALLDEVADVDGVPLAQGDVWGYAQVVDQDGEPIGNPGTGAPDHRDQLARGRAEHLDADEGRPPRATDDEVSSTSATPTTPAGGRRPRDDPRARAPGDRTVAGIARVGGADSPGGRLLRDVHHRGRPALVGEVGQFDSISVAAEDGVSQQELVGRIARPAPTASRRSPASDGHRGEPGRHPCARACRSSTTFMLVFAVVALLVGGFIIFNTFFITVAQRTRENALLRAIGATGARSSPPC